MSVHKSICDSVATVIGALSGAPTTVVRKEAVRLPVDSLPIVLVVPGNAGGVEFAGLGDGGTDFGWVIRSYEVIVVCMRAGNQLHQTSIDTVPQFAQDVFRALAKPTLSGVSTIFDCEFAPFDEWSNTAYQNNVEMTVMLFSYKNLEARNG